MPAGSFTFGGTIGFGALLSAQEIGSQGAQDGQVVMCMAVTNATVGFIQDPLDCVLDATAAESGSQEQSSLGGRYGIQIRCRCFGDSCEHFIHCGLFILIVLHRPSHLCVGQEFTRDCKCL